MRFLEGPQGSRAAVLPVEDYPGQIVSDLFGEAASSLTPACSGKQSEAIAVIREEVAISRVCCLPYNG